MEPTKEKKTDNTALYIVYAAAAYFGLQFLLKPKRTQSAVVVNYPVTDPAAQAALPPAATPELKPLPAPKNTWVAESFPLRKGMKGPKIKVLQQKLSITADAAFGNNTEAALLSKYGISIVSQDLYKTITSAQPSKGTTVVPLTSAWITESFPLRKGMRGPNIKVLQQKLGITADGAFGSGTEAAVIKKFGAATVSEALFNSLSKPLPSTFSSLIENFIPKPIITKDNSAVLQNGSRGTDVYRLQKWLGFKEKKVAKKGEPIADSIFGKQTLAALQKKTGKPTITVSQLNSFTGQVSGLGYLGEILVTKRNATVLDGRLSPHRTVPGGTILGTRTMELRDPDSNKAYTQFKTVDGFHRWVDTDAV